MKNKKAIKWFMSELPLLVRQKVITQEAAESIDNYYGSMKQEGGLKIALGIFSVIGASCVGLGLILIFAYNWDNLTKIQRLILAFLPLVISLIFLTRAYFRNEQSMAVREGLSVFNVLSVGGCISLISQTYHLPGDIDSFLLIWSLLCVPLVYVMLSNVTAVLYLISITSWATMSQIAGGHALLFWPLAAIIAPYFLSLLRKNSYSSTAVWMSYAMCLCFSVSVGISLEKTLPGLWIIVYSSFYAILYLVGKLYFQHGTSAWQRPFQNIGSLGLLILSYMFTFKWVWRSIGWHYFRVFGRYHADAGLADYIITVFLVILAVSLLVRVFRKRNLLDLSFGIMPILAVICYSTVSAYNNFEMAMWVYSFYVLYLGVVSVVRGVKVNHSGVMNGGIFLLSVILYTRFVDASLGIIERAVLFIAIGICFILSNVFFSKRMIKEVGHG